MLRPSVRSRSEMQYNLQAFATWSHEMAYALGLFFSDGCVQQPPHGSLRVSFSNTDLETVEWWHSYLGNHNRIHTHNPKMLNGSVRRRVLYTSVVTSDTLGSQILGLGGCPRKSVVDVGVPSVPEEFLGSFLRGFFDGDGGIWIGSGKGMLGGKQLCVSLTSNSQQFRQQLVGMLASKGVRSVLSHITLKVSGGSAERFCQWVYNTPGHRMSRKHNVWVEWRTHRNALGGLIADSDPWANLRGFRQQPWHFLVGTMSDRALAKQLGLSHSAVSSARVKLGIPPVRPGKLGIPSDQQEKVT